MSWEEPIRTVNYPLSYLLFPTIYFSQNVVEVVIAWNEKSMGKFKLGRAPSFECRVLLAWTRKHKKRKPVLTHAVRVGFGFTF